MAYGFNNDKSKFNLANLKDYVVAWTNSNPSNNMGLYSVILSLYEDVDINDYSYYEILYLVNKVPTNSYLGNTKMLSTGRLPLIAGYDKKSSFILQHISGSVYRERMGEVLRPETTKGTFNFYMCTTGNAGTESNDYLIPYQILLYK